MQLSKLEMILNIGESFFSVTEAPDLLVKILDGAKQICNSERATLFLVDPQKKGKEEMLFSYMATNIGGQIQEIQVPAGMGIVGHTYKTKEPQIVNDVGSSPYFLPKFDQLTQFKTESILSVPLVDPKKDTLGVIQVLNKKEGQFDNEDLKEVKLLSLLAASALSRIQDKKEMKKMKKKIEQYRKNNDFSKMVLETSHDGLKKIYEKIKVVANSNSSVLVLGESGTGKEVMARLIHEQSDRREGPFIAVNCAAIPKELFESELFGIKKGTATGVEEREGLFQQASGGTLFFDEIGEMPFELQSKLLRVLQQRAVGKLGDKGQEIPVDFRLISATNKDLKTEIAKDGTFREDLFFRINVFEFVLPPLRERASDLPGLASELVQSICSEQNFTHKPLSEESIGKLKDYDWPGNIRELKNVLERACVLSQSEDVIPAENIILPKDQSKVSASLHIVNEKNNIENFSIDNEDMNSATKKFQKAYALQVVKSLAGNKSQAAKELKLSREGLRKILNRDVA